MLMAATVLILCACYAKIIERFPHGGGGYVVASALLGPRFGVVSGAALLVDYVLTITVSIAAAGDALFSFLPSDAAGTKLAAETVLVLFLTTINIRGVKESILTLLPVFLLFLLTHVVLILGGIVSHGDALPRVVADIHDDALSATPRSASAACSSSALQRRLHLAGHTMVILPARVAS
jgi:amino acid transporter